MNKYKWIILVFTFLFITSCNNTSSGRKLIHSADAIPKIEISLDNKNILNIYEYTQGNGNKVSVTDGTWQIKDNTIFFWFNQVNSDTWMGKSLNAIFDINNQAIQNLVSKYSKEINIKDKSISFPIEHDSYTNKDKINYLGYVFYFN
jgi:hypothetical protein